ncbi:HAMP domain-containing histidine kinase [Arsenicitalea aurantiaca]|uniref:histidine kinase n=2 Tax=Arsenicitalea aurantiaca TaxID=1783274 RepID=A0A433XA77_9HYPH|nr:HAMP domain-containing histidine kinase [Arsenicitalea aurantiaca]
MMQKGSIAASLFWLSAGWLIVALVATAFLLTELYSRALDTSLTETLEFHLGTLVERTLVEGDPASAEVAVQDPRFSRPGSGWYWAVTAQEGPVVNLSASLAGSIPPSIQTPFGTSTLRTQVIRDSFGTQIRAIEREVTLNGQRLRFLVTGSLDEILVLVDDFRGQTLIVLGAVGVMLAIMSAIVFRLALRPVERLREAIEQVREGERQAVEGSYPSEIAPLAEEVNELLRSNTQIIERARNQVGNLAHGLKTPLAVMRNEASAEQGALATVVLAESEKMTTLVSTYLDRARIAARTAIVGKKADATMVMLRLVRVMEKLNPHCVIAFQRPDASLPWFRGDEGDLEEMAGNLLDNACKFSGGQVAVSMQAERVASGAMLLIRIEDDGPGLSETEAREVLRRGVRLDERTPGSGLGLDIVKELVDVYGGSLQLKRSVLGGLLAELRLPVAKLGGMGRS